MTGLALLFVAVFVLNVIPVFAPPTWVAMSLVGFRHPDASPLLLAGVAALGATGGRTVLASLSERLVRNRLIGDATRANVDVIRQKLEGKRALTAAAMLVYAVSPLPSNYLFIAYGLTSLPVVRVAVPFFLGRFVSYAGWTMLAQSISSHLAPGTRVAGSYFDVYFVLTQAGTLAALYLFARIDWSALFHERRLRLLPRGRQSSAP